MIGILVRISFRTFGTSPKKKSANTPAETPNPARTVPMAKAFFELRPIKFGRWVVLRRLVISPHIVYRMAETWFRRCHGIFAHTWVHRETCRPCRLVEDHTLVEECGRSPEHNLEMAARRLETLRVYTGAEYYHIDPNAINKSDLERL